MYHNDLSLTPAAGSVANLTLKCASTTDLPSAKQSFPTWLRDEALSFVTRGKTICSTENI